MNIALVTWIGNGNFGTSLQSYALHYFLQQNGHNVSILTAQPGPFSWKGYIKYWLSFLGWRVSKKQATNIDNSPKYYKFSRFVNKYYNRPSFYTKKQWKRFVSKTDYFISGSDQIWNTYYTFNPFFFLDFAIDKPKIAYASSIGADSVKTECRDEVKKLLCRFSKIGVREQTAVKELSKLTDRKDIVQVLDPTFLLDSSDWQKLMSDAEIELQIPRDFILCYLIGNRESYLDQIKDIQQRSGIDNIIIIPSVESPDFLIDNAIIYKSATPAEFIYLIAKSSLVCTDSFHATALCVNFEKNFVEFLRFSDNDKASQNSRVYDLLDTFNLRKRIYINGASQLWNEPINYDPIRSILYEERIRSKSFLLNSLSHNLCR